MKPVLPHIISECLLNLNEKNSTIWPKINEKYLEKKLVNVVVQVNGKKRSLVSCKKDISEGELTKVIKNKEELKKYFFNKKTLKTIYVKNKIINFILK